MERPAARSSAVARRLRVLLLALAVPGLFAGVAVAQTRPGAGAPRGARRCAGNDPQEGRPVVDAGGPATVATPAAPAPALTATGYVVPPTAPVATSDAGAVVEAKTLDGGTHVFKFSSLDIEGRVQSPQLVYFLRRVRAEFSAGDLGHRSFIREMSETRKESSF